MARTSARMTLIAAALLWSISGVLLKTLPNVHWLAVAGMRSAFGIVIFLPGFVLPRPPLKQLLLAILLYVLLVSALMGSMQLGTAAQGIWLQYIAPAVVALWVWAVQKQRLRRAEVLAVALTVIAVGLIVTGGSGTRHLQSVGLGILSGFGFGLFVVLLKSMGDVPPASIYLWTNLATAVLLLPLLPALHIRFPTGAQELGLLAVMGICQLCLPYYLFQRGLVHTRAVEASLIVLLEPILNPVWVFLFIHEVPGSRVLAGCGLIAVGLVAFAFSPREREPATASDEMAAEASSSR